MLKQGRILTSIASAAVVLGLAAWALGSAGTATSDEWEIPTELKAGPAIATADPATGSGVKIDRFDNVQKKAGEKAGLVDERTNKTYFSIEVTNSKLVGSCQPRVGTTPLKPTRTTFLVLDVKASLAADVGVKVGGSGGELFMPLVAETFSVTSGSGVPDRNVGSESAWGCFADAALLPPVVNPGQSVSGKVVLDVDSRTGKVVYDPEANGGWSWPYGG